MDLCPPQQAATAVGRLNDRLRQELGSQPRFAWLWGGNLFALLHETDSDGQEVYDLKETRTPAGLVSLTRVPRVHKIPLVAEAYQACFIFCVHTQGHPNAPAQWMPWGSNLRTPTGQRAHCLHSAPHTAPTLDYTMEIVRAVRRVLDVHQKGKDAVCEQLDKQRREQEALDMARYDRNVGDVVCAGLEERELLPVGIAREAGSKEGSVVVSFPAVEKSTS